MAYELDDGDVPHGRLPSAETAALVRRCASRFGSDPRKARAWARWLIYTEDFRSLIVRRVETVQSDKETREEIGKHVDLTNNVGLDITRATSVCWRQGVRRSISGVTDKQLDAFRELELESKIDVHAIAWNQIASLVGPIIVVPMVRDQQLRWDVLLPTYVDLVADPEDPYGCPIAAAWSMRPCEGAPRRRRDAADTVLLDGHSWRYYSTAGGRIELIEEVEHGLGYFPGEPLGFSVVHDGDWYGGCRRHQRLVDATVSIGVLNAALSFVRKAQNKRLLSIIGDLEGMPKMQKLDPEIPVAMHADQNQRLDITTLDFDTAPKHFIEHAEWIMRQVADTYGGAVADDGKGGRRVVFDDKALTEIRNEQLPFARSFERGLWAKAVEVCRVLRHPRFARLPSAADIRAGLQLDFGKLARSFADPAAEAAYIDWLISKGALDQVELTRRIEGSNLSDEQVWALIDRRLANQAKFNDEVTKRNLGMNGSKIQSAAQAFGALGPIAKQQNPAPDGGADAQGNDNGDREREPG